jgi:ATP-dependent Lon protease
MADRRRVSSASSTASSSNATDSEDNTVSTSSATTPTTSEEEHTEQSQPPKKRRAKRRGATASTSTVSTTIIKSKAKTKTKTKTKTKRKPRQQRQKKAIQQLGDFIEKLKQRRYANPEDEEYFRGLQPQDRKRIKRTEDALYDTDIEKTPLRFRILHSNIHDTLKLVCLKKLDQLDNMQSYSDEYFKLLQWVQRVAKLPIGKYKELPISQQNNVEDISNFLTNIRTRLDKNVYGHKHVKEHIVRLLAKWIANKEAKGLVIGLEGSPGTGKTSICLEICEALGLPSGFISLGGLSCAEYLVGFNFTYEGSRFGRIAEVLMYADYTNPVLFFDEVDKISQTSRGDEIVNTLIHVTDVTQNHDFRDKYFSEVPIDLSRCIIIFSYNNAELVNPILKDRMVTIKASGYTQTDKIAICKKHMIPKILQEYGFKDNEIQFNDDVIRSIISLTEDEHGVRNLKRSLEDIVSQLNVVRLLQTPIFEKDEKDKEPIKFPLSVTDKIVRHFVARKEKSNAEMAMMYI